MITLKEFLAEPQTMYDGGIVNMQDGGDPLEELIDKTTDLRQRAENIPVPTEESSVGDIVEYAGKVGRKAIKRIPGVGLIDPSPAGEGSAIYTPEEVIDLLEMTKTARRWPTTKVYNNIINKGIENKNILNFGSGSQEIIDASKALKQISDKNTVTNYDISLGNNDVLNQTYDLVMASNVLNVQPNMDRLYRTIDEISNSTEQGGQIIFNLPSSPRKGVYDNLSTKEAKDMLAQKFKERGVEGTWKGEIFTGNKEMGKYRGGQVRPMYDGGLVLA